MKRCERTLAGLLVTVALCAVLAVPALASEELIGFWEWTRTVGGFSGVDWTPASEGLTKQLELRVDGTAHLYYDEDWQDSGTFDLSGPVQIELEDFWLLGGTWQIAEVEGVRHLTLLSPCCDMFDHWFVERAPVPVGNRTTTFGAVKRLFR